MKLYRWYHFQLAGGAIFYHTKVQATIAQLSTEAELAFMANAGKAAIYLQLILEEIGLQWLCLTEIQCDNWGAGQLTNAQQPI